MRENTLNLGSNQIEFSSSDIEILQFLSSFTPSSLDLGFITYLSLYPIILRSLFYSQCSKIQLKAAHLGGFYDGENPLPFQKG